MTPARTSSGADEGFQRRRALLPIPADSLDIAQVPVERDAFNGPLSGDIIHGDLDGVAAGLEGAAGGGVGGVDKHVLAKARFADGSCSEPWCVGGGHEACAVEASVALAANEDVIVNDDLPEERLTVCVRECG